MYSSGFSSDLWIRLKNLIIFICSIYLVVSFFLMPFDFLKSFLLEKKFGLSTQTLAGWLADLAKKIFLALLFNLAIYLIFYALLDIAPQTWWLWAAFLSFLFAITLNILFPVLLIPLFYKLIPLPDQALKAEILATCKRCHVSPMQSYEIKLSQKTVRANAAVVGMGKTRRVLLSDTLLESFSNEEIRMVVAHEIGHHVEKHLGKTVIIAGLLSVMGLFALNQLFSRSFLMDPVSLPLLMLIGAAAQLLSTPILSAISRKHEREADRYALRIYQDVTVFERLMNKLSTRNLSNPNPSAFEEWFFYTHPSAKNRILAAKKTISNSPHAA